MTDRHSIRHSPRRPAQQRRGGGLQSRSAPGLQQDRNPAACVMVIFGVSGDLTVAQADAVALRPRGRASRCRPASRSSASPAGTGRDDEFRAEMREAVKEYATTPVHRRSAGTRSRAGSSTSRAISTTRETYRAARASGWTTVDQRARHQRQPPLLPGDAAQLLRARSSATSARPGWPSARRSTATRPTAGTGSWSKSRSGTTSTAPAS